MTPPRYNVPGQTVFVTVQGVARAMRFLPRKDVRDSIDFLFALLVAKYGLLVSEFCFLSNHWHLVAADPGGRISDFLQEFNSRLRKQLNALRGRTGSNHEREPGIQVIADAGGILQKLIYTLVNPVAARLVKGLFAWKGCSSLRMRYGETVTFARPKCGMWKETKPPKRRGKHPSRGRLRYRGRSSAPETASFTLARPTILEDKTDDELRDHVIEKAKAEALRVRRELRAQGKSEVVGWRKVVAGHYMDEAKSSRVLFQRRPRVTGTDDDACAEMVDTIETFVKSYRAAVEQFKVDRGVEFPFGTLQMVRRHHVACAPPPS